MAIDKRVLYRIDENGTPQETEFRNSAGNTTFDKGSTGLTSENVQGAIEELKGLVDNGSSGGGDIPQGAVTQINNKTPNAAGKVTLDASDIGALPDSTKYGKTLTFSYTANTGVLTLSLNDQDGTVLDTKTVDLPLELLIESGSVKSCTQANKPVQGYVVGDKYIDFVLANNSHLYVLVSDLVDQVDVTPSGNGNAVTALSVTGNNITYTKGKTFVETTRKVNGKALNTDITLSASDVNALADTIKYAGSETAGGVANSAKKWKDGITITASGDVSGSVSFDGSTSKTIDLTLGNSGVVAGSYSAVTVNAKGLVTNGNQLIEWGTSGQTTPSDTLAKGGIFLKEV